MKNKKKSKKFTIINWIFIENNNSRKIKMKKFEKTIWCDLNNLTRKIYLKKARFLGICINKKNSCKHFLISIKTIRIIIYNNKMSHLLKGFN